MSDRARPPEKKDLGPHPNCPWCRGTGECDNAQFRCPCRWSTSPARANAEALALQRQAADALARLRQEHADAHERLHDSVPIDVGGKTLTLTERIAELEQTADDALKRNEELEAELARVTAGTTQPEGELQKIRMAFDEVRRIIETCDAPERLYGSHAKVYAEGIEAGSRDAQQLGVRVEKLEAELARVTAEREHACREWLQRIAEAHNAKAEAERRLAEVVEALQVKTAECIARRAHEGQREKTGEAPYIRHVERVVALVDGDEAKAVAWLHDVLEDTFITAVDLKAAGISERVIAAVDLLTRIPHQPYELYILDLRLSGNPLALAVKRADLQDHLRPNCPESLRPRYERALEALAAVRPEGEK